MSRSSHPKAKAIPPVINPPSSPVQDQETLLVRRTAAYKVSEDSFRFAKLLRAIGLAIAGIFPLVALFTNVSGTEYSAAFGLLMISACIACLALTIYSVIEVQARTIADVLNTADAYTPGKPEGRILRPVR